MVLPQPIDPWIAVNLSMLWPGCGQLYSRAVLKGIGFAIATFILLYYAGWSLFAAQGNTLTGLLVLAVLAILYIFNLFDAYNTIRPLPHPDPRTIYQPTQNRWYGLFLSQILPGFGHLYFQRAAMGGVFLGVGVLTTYLANFYPFLLPIPPVIWAIACYHLYLTTAPAAQQRVRSRAATASHGLIAIIIAGVLILRLTVGYIPPWINQALLQCIVPSSSMEPTLQVGDRMFVKRDDLYWPRVNDLVVFQVPIEAIASLDIDPETLFVKRIIGLPGQTVAVKNGQVLINQIPIQEPYDASEPVYQWGPEVVPPNAYFVLGDNRNESADSHVWGFLPREDILGKSYKIYWPPQRIQALM